MGRTKIRTTERRAAAAEILRTHERQERRRKFLIYGIGAITLAAIVIPTTVLLVGAQQQEAAIQTAAGKAIAGVRTFSNLSRNHLASPGPFAQNPPAGGRPLAQLRQLWHLYPAHRRRSRRPLSRTRSSLGYLWTLAAERRSASPHSSSQSTEL